MVNYTKTKIIHYKNDKGDDINLQCLDDDENAFDLTGYTIKWRVAEPESATLKFEATGVPVTPTEGKFKVTVDGTTVKFDEAPKTYNTQAILTKTGYELTFEGVTVEVREKLPAGA